MVELIVLIILLVSLAVIGFMLWKKIPVLNQLPEVHEGIQKDNIVSVVKKKIKNISFDKLIFLKTLSKIRVYTLKAEKLVDHHLQKTRKKIVKKQEEVKAEQKKENNKPE